MTKLPSLEPEQLGSRTGAARGPWINPLIEYSPRRLDAVRHALSVHPAILDSAAAVVAAGICAWVVTARPGPVDATALALALLAAAALAARSRNPPAVAGAVSLLAVLSVTVTGDLNGMEAPLALSLYSVARHRGLTLAWLVAGGAVAAVTVALVVEGAPDPAGSGRIHLLPRIPLGGVASVWGAVLIALAVGLSLKARRAHRISLIERGRRLTRERQQQAELAAAAERVTAADDLQDRVARSLTSMISLGDEARQAEEVEAARAALEHLTDQGRLTLAEITRARGEREAPESSAISEADSTDLDELVDRFRAIGLPVRLIRTGSPLPDDPHLGLTVHRIVQESLTNVLRYAPSTPTAVVLVSREGEHDEQISVVVTDEGPRHEERPSDDLLSDIASGVGVGRGIIGMRERASVYGGTVTAGPLRGGWQVIARLTWEDPQAASRAAGPAIRPAEEARELHRSPSSSR